MKKTFTFILVFLCLIITAGFFTKDIIVKETLKYYLKSNFKVASSWGNLNLGFKKLSLEKVNLSRENFEISVKNLEFEYEFDFPRQLKPNYLKIGDLVIDNKKIKNLNLIFELQDKRLNFYNFQANFINDSALISGFVDFSNLGNVCIVIAVEDIALKSVVYLFADKKDVSLAGEFSGKTKACFTGNKINDFYLDIDNLKGGAINFQKETALDFLKGRVDEKSYLYLLDNLKNYQYDKGKIAAGVDKEDIIFRANFDSQMSGERNITIKLHNLLAK